MATTDNELNDLIINDLTQEEYDNLVATGQVQEGQIYATDGSGGGGGGTTGGLESVAHDETLSGAGTDDSPLGLSKAIKDEIADKAPKETVETLTTAVSDIMLNYLQKSGGTMTGTLGVPELNVATAEGTLNMSITAGVATIATNNGLDIVSQTKFDTAPTTDDATTWANANDTSLVTKRQVATALSESGDCGLIIRRL